MNKNNIDDINVGVKEINSWGDYLRVKKININNFFKYNC